MNSVATKIASALRAQGLTRLIPAAPKGVPAFPDNADNNLDGAYKQENLTDPGIRNMVTGSGRGPVIGGYNRAMSTIGSGSSGGSY